MPDDENIDYQIARRELERAIDELRALRGLAPIYGAKIETSVAIVPIQVLSELEDRALALCEGEYVEFPLAIEILESWFGRPIPSAELRWAFERLTKLGLIECQLGDSWAFSNVVPESSVLWRTKFRATHFGVEYLKASANPDE